MIHNEKDFSRTVALAGPSCSGKSTIFDALRSKLGSSSASFLSFDDYFVGVENVEDVSTQDWESPEQVRMEDFQYDLTQLKAGRSLEINTKSRENISRRVSQIYVEAKPLIITEGYLVLWSKAVRNLIDTSIYIDIPEEVMIERRLRRANQLDPWDTDEYIRTRLPKGTREFVLPQRSQADLVLDGTQPIEDSLNIVLDVLGE